jgi:hypothetical protein
MYEEWLRLREKEEPFVVQFLFLGIVRIFLFLDYVSMFENKR